MKVVLVVGALLGGLVLLLWQLFPDALGHEGGRMSFVFYLVWMLVAGSAIIATFRQRWAEAAKHAVAWTLICLGLVAGYSVRHDLERLAKGVVASLVPGMAVSMGEGAVAVRQSGDGHYYLTATIGGAELRMLVDTGASSVALSAEDARRIGLDPQALDFSERASTANGVTRAAPVRLAAIDVGGIVIEDVRAVVLQPGATPISLLGMSFLGRLASWQVEGDELLLRP